MVGIVIFIHEFGHFITAKFSGIKVEEFAFGFGKKIFGKKVGDTEYKLNLFPLGGYVRLLGQEQESDNPRSYSKKNVGIRLIVLLAGVVMNFICAIVTFFIILGIRDFEIYVPKLAEYHFYGAVSEVQNKPVIAEVIEGTAASEAQLPVNSFIWSIGGIDIKEVNDLNNLLERFEGQEVVMRLLSNSGQWKDITITPREVEEEGVLLGVKYYDGVASYYKLDYTRNKLFAGVLHSFNFTGYTLSVFKDLIVLSFEEKSVEPISTGVHGVVGMATVLLDVVRVGEVADILELLANVNISLFLVNLLPIPGLDGGYILILVLEKILRRKIPERYQEWGVRIGLGVLVLLAILIGIKDVVQFDIIGRLFNRIKSLF